MFMPRDSFPPNLPLTEQDFRSCGWERILTDGSCDDYDSMCHAFAEAAQKAKSCASIAKIKILWLLADACSMMLSPTSSNEPFKPSLVSRTRRSPIPDDFTDSEISFFARVARLVDNAWLRARLADLVWLRMRPRDPIFALTAIDSYRSVPLTADAWFAGADKCWERATTLVGMLGKGAGTRHDDIKRALMDAFEAATAADNYLGLKLSELLRRCAVHEHDSDTIAGRLRALGRDFEALNDLGSARDFYSGSSKWYKPSNAAMATAMTVAVAECWVRDAESRTSAGQPSHVAASMLYEQAIQTFRSIPRAERNTHKVDERMAVLRQRVQESGARSADEMHVVQSPGVDITELADKSAALVKGKSALEALKIFANIYSLPDVQKLRAIAIRNLTNHPLQALLHRSVLSRDGRVVARRPSASVSPISSTENELAIHSEMVSSHGLHVNMAVEAVLLPALGTLRTEHRLREVDFVDISRQSITVPVGRAGLLGKALFAGYEWDFVCAVHLVVPQVEHMMRYHLKRLGVSTTTLDQEGIETENGLTALMSLQGSERIFGDDIRFAIRALFCDHFGPNLRNEIAHGLLDEDECRSAYSVYAWWLVLKLVFNPFWNALHGATSSGERTDGAATDADQGQAI